VKWLLVSPKDPTPLNFVEKTFLNSHKNLRNFSSSKVSRYTVVRSYWKGTVSKALLQLNSDHKQGCSMHVILNCTCA